MLGIGMMGLGLMGRRPAGPLLFAVDLTSLSLGDMTAAAFLAATGLSFSRASNGFRVQTSASAISAALTGNDRPRVGSVGAAWGRGLLVEETRVNNSLNSADWSQGVATSITVVANDASSPDGTTTAAKGTLTGAGASQWRNAVMSLAAGNWVGSWWTKAGTTPGATYDLYDGSHSVDLSTASYSFGAPNWARQVTGIGTLAGSSNVFLFPIVSGGTNGTMWGWGWQVEGGKFTTELIDTAGVTATRAGERLYHASGSSLVDSGRLGLELKLVPKAASNQYGANMFIWNVDANNQAWIDSSTRQVNVKIGGTTQTLATAMTWAAQDVVELWVSAGGGSQQTTAAYRVNGGATTQLGTAAALGTLTVGGALDLFCSSTSNQLTAWLQSINAYKASSKPSWA